MSTPIKPISMFSRNRAAFWLLTLLLWLGIGAAANAAEILFVHAPSGGAPAATDQKLIDQLSRGLGHKVKLRPVASAAEKPAGSVAVSNRLSLARGH